MGFKSDELDAFIRVLAAVAYLTSPEIKSEHLSEIL